MPKIQIDTIEKIARENIRDTSKVDKLMASLRKLAAEKEEQDRNKDSGRKVAVVIPASEDSDGEYTLHLADRLEDLDFSEVDLSKPLKQSCQTEAQNSSPVWFKCIFHGTKSY